MKEMSPDTRPRIRGENNCKYYAENKKEMGQQGSDYEYEMKGKLKRIREREIPIFI